MKIGLFVISIVGALSSAGCATGPGGTNSASNRIIAGTVGGAALGGLAGKAIGGDAITGAMVGAVAGGALGAATNANRTFKRDSRGYCVLVDENGNQVFDAQGQAIIDYAKPC